MHAYKHENDQKQLKTDGSSFPYLLFWVQKAKVFNQGLAQLQELE